MIELDYKRLGLFRTKRFFFADHLPEIVNGFDFVICHTYLNLPFTAPFVCRQHNTVLIDLTQDHDNLFSQIHKTRRSVIRQGLKMDFKFIIQPPSLKNLIDYRRFHNKYLVPRGVEPIISLNFLKALSGIMSVCIGQYNDQTLIIMLVINDGQTARNLFIARNENGPYTKESYYIGSALQWEVFNHYQRLGYTTYDMGGLIAGQASSSYGLNQYKISYGGEICPYYYFEAALTRIARVLTASKPIILKSLKKMWKIPLLLTHTSGNHNHPIH